MIEKKCLSYRYNSLIIKYLAPRLSRVLKVDLEVNYGLESN